MEPLNGRRLKPNLPKRSGPFRGLGIQSAKAFDRFSYQFGYRDFSYQASLSNAVRVNLTPRVFTANEAPKEVEIFLHHEMAQTPLPPDKLFFCCLSASESGGATPFAGVTTSQGI